jgi:hypothetical protein
LTIEKENAVTIFRKFIATLTTRPAFLDESKKLQVQFDSLPEFVRHALKGQTELPPDAAKSLTDLQRSIDKKS